jgi:hypothetical protein
MIEQRRLLAATTTTTSGAPIGGDSEHRDGSLGGGECAEAGDQKP